MRLSVKYGGKQGQEFGLELSTKHDRGAERELPSPKHTGLSGKSRRALVSYPQSSMCQTPASRCSPRARAKPQSARRARTILKKSRRFAFAGTGLARPKPSRPSFTRESFRQVHDTVSKAECERLFEEFSSSRSNGRSNTSSAPISPERRGDRTRSSDLAAKPARRTRRRVVPSGIGPPAFVCAVRSQHAFKATTIDRKRIDAHANVVAQWAVNQGQGVIIR